MQRGWVVGLAGAAVTFVLLGYPRVPAMLGLLGYGAVAAFVLDPSLAGALGRLGPDPRWPTLAVLPVTWRDLVHGTVGLALPQAALTLGNAVIATAREHNRLFSNRPITVRTLTWDRGLMNIGAAVLGGVPVCRGAGGLAGHVRSGRGWAARW